MSKQVQIGEIVESLVQRRGWGKRLLQTGRGIEIHPALVIAGVLAGGEIVGVAGMFLAVPPSPPSGSCGGICGFMTATTAERDRGIVGSTARVRNAPRAGFRPPSPQGDDI